jgi:hypothetical protein
VVDITLCVAFGSTADHAVWAGTYRTDELPEVGMRTELRLTDSSIEKTDHDSIVAEVIYSDVDSDGDPVVYLFAGPQIPDADVTDLLVQSSWVELGEEAAFGVMTILDAAPPTAAIHDVLLVIGDPSRTDEQGNPDVEAWHRVVAPHDPMIPMFAERLYLDPTDSMSDPDEDDDFDDDREFPEGDAAVDGEFPDSRMTNLDIDLDEPGSPDEGYPCLVFYASKSEPGEAQLGFWVTSLGELTGFDLVAAGWVRLTPEEFDAGDFRVAERVELALRTEIVTDLDEDGDPFLVDFEITDAIDVREDQYELLPHLLQEQAKASHELARVEDVIRAWSEDFPSR